MNKHLIFLASITLVIIGGCSPIKSSPKEEKHQLELTLHQVQTNIDDLRHDLNCMQTELQILDGKIKNQEKSIADLKHQYLDKQKKEMQALTQQINTLQTKVGGYDSKQENTEKDIRQLSGHANDTSSALTQYKERINELEKELIAHKRRFEEVSKLKNTLESVAKTIRAATGKDFYSYKVKSGDSLEKIAKNHKTTVEALKSTNKLDNDLIVIGQELRIPN